MKNKFYFSNFSFGFREFSTNKTLNATPFNYPIPFTYVNSKDKPIILYFSIYDLLPTTFKDKLRNVLRYEDIYTVYIKIRYNEDNFFMAGNQFGFQFSSDSDLEDLLSIVTSRLEDYFQSYNLSDDSIVYIQLSFKKLDQKLFSEFKLKKPSHISEKEHIITESNFNIPFSINKNSLGKELPTEKLNGLITRIDLQFNNKNLNFLNCILNKSKTLRKGHKDNITSFNENFKFYLLRDNNYYVLAVNIFNDYIEKIRYSLEGVVINRVIDKIDNGLITRNVGEKTIVIKDGNILSVKQDIKLKAIEKPSIKNISVQNNNIGVIDIETFVDNDGLVKVYALGFKTNLDPKPTTYYIDKDMDSSKLILLLTNELLRSKYSDINFYCHNLGGYDVVFILKVLYEYNDNNPDDKYKISCILRDDKIIKLTVTKDKNSFRIIDSYPMLPSSLKTLGDNFEVKSLKSTFPYNFSKQENLFYEGDTPNIEYYENMSPDDYNKILTNHWHFKYETIKYLENDLNCLHEIITKVNKQVFLDYGVSMLDSLTISGLAVRIFLKDFYNKNIPKIDKSGIYRDLKDGYYGGITEVYRPYGENLYYYDINSLYPFVALQDMPGLTCNKVTYYNKNYNIENLFGFYYCKIENYSKNYLGLLPLRTKSGLTFPLGKWKGWYFSEELKYAKLNGYKITPLKGYNFSRERDVFREYINKIYKIKAYPLNNTQKGMAKSLLNNLLGRFGIGMEKPETKIVTLKEFNVISLINKVTSYKKLSEDKLLVSYIPKLDYDIIKSHNLDFLKIVNKYKDEELRSMDVASIAISAAVTAYARVYISSIKLNILEKGGKIYYSDTDSIVTNIQLDDDIVSSNEIGKLKLEHILDKAMFVSGKLYWMKNNSGKILIKAKGIKSNSLNEKDFEELLCNKNIETAIKSESKIDWLLGQVKIGSKKVIINSDNYTKRTKLYDNKGMWVDTKPIFINNIDKALVLSNKKSIIPYKTSKTIVIKSSSHWLNYLWLVGLGLGYCLSRLLREDDDISTDVIHLNSDTNNDNNVESNVKFKPKEENTKISLSNDNDYQNNISSYEDIREDVTENDESYISDSDLQNLSPLNSDKTLYEGFKMKLDEIRNIGTGESVNQTDTKSNTIDLTVDNTTQTIKTETSQTLNTLSRTEKWLKDQTSENDETSPDLSKDKFSPRTLEALDEEIDLNQNNLNALNNLIKDETTKDSIKETLLEERRYLLDQKQKHLAAEMQEAKNTSFNDVDREKLSSDIKELKDKTDKLVNKFKEFHEEDE